MNKKLLITGVMTSLLFLGCSEKTVVKDETVKSMDSYDIVIAKSIKDCKEHNIILNEERTNEFMRRSPLKTIEKAAKQTAQTPKKLCMFFAEETSLEKVEKIDEFTAKVVGKCEKVGVTLPKDKIHEKITNLPFFVIKKGLAMQNEASLKECEVMKKKYK